MLGPSRPQAARQGDLIITGPVQLGKSKEPAVRGSATVPREESREGAAPGEAEIRAGLYIGCLLPRRALHMSARGKAQRQAMAADLVVPRPVRRTRRYRIGPPFRASKLGYVGRSLAAVPTVVVSVLSVSSILFPNRPVSGSLARSLHVLFGVWECATRGGAGSRGRITAGD